MLVISWKQLMKPVWLSYEVKIFLYSNILVILPALFLFLDHLKEIRLIIFLVIVLFFTVCVGVLLIWFWMSRQRGKIWFRFKRNHQFDGNKICLDETITNVDLEELSFCRFYVLAMSTDQFHENNKLGQGVFGLVYKVIFFRGLIHPNSGSCKYKYLLISSFYFVHRE